MGLIGKILNFSRQVVNAVTVGQSVTDHGGGRNITLDHYSSPGDDSHPLPGDKVAGLKQRQEGTFCGVGYLDEVNPPISAPGEKRSYARSSGGATVSQVWQKNTGEILISNDTVTLTISPGGAVSLVSSGTVNINGVTIDPSGNVTIPTSLILNGREINLHTHPITGGSSAPGPTGPNI